MKIGKPAIAGTLESNDAMVSIVPDPEVKGIEFELESVVIHQYGNQIRKVVLEVLGRLGVDGVKVSVNDRGALDCTLKARTECAVFRALGQTEPLPWGGDIKA